MTLLDISHLVTDPEKRADHIFASTGRTQAINTLVINHENEPRQKEMLQAWSYALHHVIKTADKSVIARAIAPYAVSPLYKEYPNFLLHDYPSSRMAYQAAREEYCKDKIIPRIRELCKMEQAQSGAFGTLQKMYYILRTRVVNKLAA